MVHNSKLRLDDEHEKAMVIIVLIDQLKINESIFNGVVEAVLKLNTCWM